jgi:hypothetical protein
MITFSIFPREAAMSWRMFALALLFALPAPPSHAVTQDNFLVRTTSDLVALCTAGGTDDMHIAAIHFCQGYFVGADHYYLAERGSVSSAPNLFCMPNPPPTRDVAIQMFVDWAQKNPQYMSDLPVNSVIRFAAMTWPCRK